MRAFLALMWREVHERRALLAAAAVASVLPVLAPLLPTSGSNPASDTREAVLWVLVGTLVPLFSLLLGLTFIGRDLAEGRLGFYYAQPLSGPTIWFGKLTAVVLLVWAAQIVIMLPTMLLSPDPAHFLAPADWIGPYDPLWFIAAPLWLGPPVIVLLSHALGIVWRGRSVWLIFDLVALLAVVGTTWIVLKPFVPLVAPVAFLVGATWMGVVAYVGLILGGAVQTTAGRVDLHRSHRAMSFTLWSTLALGCVCLACWGWWVRAATPWDLDGIDSVGVGSSEWIAVTGSTSGRFDYRPRYLVNTEDGRWMPAGTSVMWNRTDFEFSPDGRLAGYPVPAGIDHWSLHVVDLDAEAPEPRPTGIVLNHRWRGFAFSTDGHRVIAIEGQQVSVFELEGAQLIAAVKIEDDYLPQWATFLDGDRVRIEAFTSKIAPNENRLWKTFHFSVGQRNLDDTAEPRKYRRTWFVPGQSGEPRRLDWNKTEAGYQPRLVDDRTGDVIADLGRLRYRSNLSVVGSRIVVIHDEDETPPYIDVFDADGRQLHRIALDQADRVLDAGLVAPNRIAFGLQSGEPSEPTDISYQTTVVDLETGKTGPVLDGYRPVLFTWRVDFSPGAGDVGSVGTRLVVGEDYKIHLWDPETNEVSSVLPIREE